MKKKHSLDYVWEKMFVAVMGLCGKGPFKQRLENVTVNSLLRLNDEDAAGDLKEETALAAARGGDK